MTIVFPIHAPNVFQALDFTFFGVLKQLEQTRTGGFDDNSINNKIIKFGHAYEQIAPLMTIRELFKRVTMSPEIGSRPLRSGFDEERLRNSPGFKEIWECQINVEELL
jgi:hypothetical protein